MPRRFHVSSRIFLGASLIYLATAGGHLYTSDAGVMYEVTRSMLTRGSFEISPDAVEAAIGSGGKSYAPWDLGMSLAFIPPDLAGRSLAAAVPVLRPSLDEVARACISLTNVPVTAWLVSLVFAACVTMGLRARTAFWAALAFAFGSMAWPYSKQPWNLQLASALQLWALVFMVRGVQKGRGGEPPVWLFFAAGTALAGAIVTRTPTILVIPPFLGYLIAERRRRKGGDFLREIGAFLAPILLGCAVVAWYNWIRFGSPLDSGHRSDPNTRFDTPLHIGLYGLLLSSGKGLFLFSPFLVCALAGFRRWIRNDRGSALLVISVSIIYVVFYARLDSWGGDWCYGPRYMLAIIPLLATASAWFVDGLPRSRAVTIALCALLAVSVAVQIPAVTVDPQMRLESIQRTQGDLGFERRTWNPQYAPLLDQTRAALRLLRGDSAWDADVDEAGASGAAEEKLSRDHWDFWWVYAAERGFLPASAAMLVAVSGFLGGVLLWYSGWRKLAEFTA